MIQTEMVLDCSPALAPGAEPTVVDLFAGIGGLSAGFAAEGFSVLGVDSEALAAPVYESAGFGKQFTHDLLAELPGEIGARETSIVIGGPPCRPWSAVNQQRRRKHHDDHGLLSIFVEHVRSLRPWICIFENVPALGSDDVYRKAVYALREDGYDVAARILHYDQFGAYSRRRRLFTIAVRGSPHGAQRFLSLLATQRAPARTVREAIAWLRDVPRGGFADHDWSQLRTIGKYAERYESGQYGWMRLLYDAPAPSFGSVAKTYILHPEAGVDGYPERVISVREALSILGFARTVRFPDGTPRAKRYQMVANAVSPQVSTAIARVANHMLTGEPLTVPSLTV